MQLINQLIQKKTETSEQFAINNDTESSIWSFYQIINLVASIRDKKLNTEVNQLWKKWLCTSESKYLIKIRQNINTDRRLISEYFNSMTESEIKSVMSRHYPIEVFMVQSFELQ